MITKTSKFLIALGGLGAGLLIFNSCRKTRHNSKIREIKNWKNWQIEFKENTNEVEKLNAINNIEDYIRESLSHQELSGYIFKSIDFAYEELVKGRVNLNVGVSIEKIAKDAPRFPPPPRPPVFPEDLFKYSPYILEIKD